MKLSIIVPVYNERGTIAQILEKLEKVELGADKEIIIVDDYSTDGTREILGLYEQKYKVVYHKKNQGKGRALRSGFAEASGDWAVVQDADMEYDPADFKKMLEKAEETGASVVYGSRRFNRKYHYFEGRYSGHLYAVGGIFLTWLTNFLYGTKITDEPTCYKMIKMDLLKNIDLECERFEFCPEITAKVAKRRIRIHEVPISYSPRHKDEGKKINWRDGLEAIWTLIKYRFKS